MKRSTVSLTSAAGRPRDRRAETDVAAHRQPRKQPVVLEHHAALGAGAGDIGMPHISASPRVGASKPATMRSKVDLPQPEAPIRQTNSPFFTRRCASRSASMRWPCSSNCLLTPNSSRMGLAVQAKFGLHAQQTSTDQHHQPVGDEAGDADHDHAADDDFGARELRALP